MRQLRVTAPAGARADLQEIIGRNDARAVRIWDLVDDGLDGPAICAELSINNRELGELLDDLQGLRDATVTLMPQSVLTLVPGRDEAPEELVDPRPLSPHEVFLAGLQSVGSWGGFLGYAAVAGAVVWIGMLTNTPFLLVAAMLIAPFAGPAMNTALATATGDLRLMGRAVVRYVAGILTLVAVVAALHLLLGPDIATNTMTATANVSAVAVVLPLVAGAAGALNLMQAERSSLVSGAATGVLVAAALAPPAGLIGMAAVISKWSMVGAGAFLLTLQLVGLNLSGALVFRLFGLSPRTARYGRGSSATSWLAVAASVVAVGALVAFQLSDRPSLQRSSVETEVTADIGRIVGQQADAGLVESNTRFTRPDIPGQDTLLAEVYVQPMGGA
ncbi:MAG: DUF389 domain-containing protein, partial [Acidimicrobiia bacterium]